MKKILLIALLLTGCATAPPYNGPEQPEVTINAPAMRAENIINQAMLSAGWEPLSTAGVLSFRKNVLKDDFWGATLYGEIAIVKFTVIPMGDNIIVHAQRYQGGEDVSKYYRADLQSALEKLKAQLSQSASSL